MLEDKRPIVLEDSLVLDAPSEVQPIQRSVFRNADQLDPKDRRNLIILYVVGTSLFIISGVSLGIAYALGDKQVPFSGIVTSDCAPCADMGLQILKNGGSAVDAAVTTWMCNGVINLHSSGLGGAGFMLIRDHRNNKSFAIDFRSTSPDGLTPENFSKPEQFIYGSKAVAVPGELAGLAIAHQYFGKLLWKDLVKPVADLARNGFALTQDAYDRMNDRDGLFDAFRQGNGKLYKLLIGPNNQSLPVGTIIKRPDYADALDIVAEDPMALYKNSSLALDISNSLNNTVTIQDLMAYRANVVPVVRTTYKDFVLETLPPPSGGAIMLHVMKILEHFNITESDRNNPLTWHRMVEAVKFAYAVFPDSYDFQNSSLTEMFVNSLLQNCSDIAKRINDSFTQPPEFYDPHYAIPSLHGTSAISVIDADDLFVASSSSLNYLYGAAIMTDKYGIVLNNDMGDFDKPFNSSQPSLRTNPNNFVKSGRRPRSAQSPTVFYNKNPKRKCGFRGAVGGVGGQEIIPAIAQYLVDVLSLNANSSYAMERARFHHSLMPDVLFVEETLSNDIVQALKAKAHNVTVWSLKTDPIAVISASTKIRQTVDGTGDFRKGGKSAKASP